MNQLVEGMKDISLDLIKKTCNGESISPEELKFILTTKQLLDKEEHKNNPIQDIIKEIQPIAPLIGTIIGL